MNAYSSSILKPIKNYLKGLLRTNFRGIPSSACSPVQCFICGVADVQKIHAEGRLSVVQCRRCGLTYYTPQPSPEALSHYYTSTDKSSYIASRPEWKWQMTPEWEAQIQHELASLETHWRLHHSPTAPIRFLELGSAYGYVLYVARQRGWDVTGIEPGTAQVEITRKVVGTPVYNCTITEAAPLLSPASYDIIYMSHVLEHTLNPLEVIQTAYQLARPGAILVIYVPNGNGLQARHSFIEWEWSGFPDHLYFFGPNSLQMMLTQAGFIPERLWSCLGHSKHEPLFSLIRERLHLHPEEALDSIVDVLGQQCLLSDLRVIARKPGG